MAEIKSTMDLVMEKLARMDLEATSDDTEEEQVKEGMRLAAEFLRGHQEDLAAAVARKESKHQKGVTKGVIIALLRNIVLPRHEEQLATCRRAISGVLAITHGSNDILSMFQDVGNILERYQEHRKQMRSQLEEAFGQQMKQLETTMAQQTGMKMKLQPAQHPKFQEEWQRLSGDLDEQYGRAIEQYKREVQRRLTDD